MSQASIVPYWPGTSKMLSQIRIFESFIFILFMHFTCDWLIAHILLYIISLLHKFREVLRIHIWFDLIEHVLKLRLILFITLVFIDAHLFLHLIVVVRHKVLHLVHYLVTALCLNGILIVFQLSRKYICLGLLKLLLLLFGLLFVDKARDFRHRFYPSILNLVCIDKPNVIEVIFNELCRHL